MASFKRDGFVSKRFAAAGVRIFAAVGLLVFAGGLKADDQATCQASDMKGDFATEPAGTLLLPLPPPLPSGPFVATGLLHFDGVNTFSGTTSSSFGGVILPAFAAMGVYSVSPDCIVTVHETTLGIIFEGYFTKDKSQVVHFEPQPGTITTNILHRSQLTTCDASALKDNWVIQDSGTIAGTTNSLFAQNGRFNFDGNGTFHGNTASSTGGTIASHTVTGTYTMASDCTFHATFTDESNNTSKIFGVLYNTGNEFYFDYQDDGTIIAGTGRQAVPSNATGTTAVVTPTSLTTDQASVVLDASGSTSGAGALSYFYRVLPGGLQPALLQSPYNPKVTVDFVNGPGTYLVQLSVTDAKGNVASTAPITLVYQP